MYAVQLWIKLEGKKITEVLICYHPSDHIYLFIIVSFNCQSVLFNFSSQTDALEAHQLKVLAASSSLTGVMRNFKVMLAYDPCMADCAMPILRAK